jgi:hypothetical protein
MRSGRIFFLLKVGNYSKEATGNFEKRGMLGLPPESGRREGCRKFNGEQALNETMGVS